MGWARKVRNYLFPGKWRSMNRNCRSGRVTYLKRKFQERKTDYLQNWFSATIWGQLLWF